MCRITVYMGGDKMCENKKCFIITPIGGDGSEIRRKADGVINSVIKPVLKEMGFTDIKAAHEITSPGSINKQVINRIVEDDLVIANLTGLNPNVMYELAVRHATMKPIVHICEDNTKLPFDIVDQRSIFYSDDMYGTEELKRKLKTMVNSSLDVENKDNPIYTATQDKIFREVAATSNDTKLEGYIINRIDDLEVLINKAVNNKLNINKSGFFVEEFLVEIELGKENDIHKFINNIKENCVDEYIKIDNYSELSTNIYGQKNSEISRISITFRSGLVRPTQSQVRNIVLVSLTEDMNLIDVSLIPF